MSDNQKIRINKYLSEVGYCSRRKADELIERKRVTVNGEVPEMGTKISDEDEVRVDGKLIRAQEKEPIYIALNKPVGIVTTTDQKREKDNIIDFINFPTRIFPIGRLDKLSEGLIFLTDDGNIVNKVLRAGNYHEKEYEVAVNKPITDLFLNGMRNGVPILGTVTRKCEVTKISKLKFKIVLTQGLNRQIRRMCEHYDYKVVKLKRIRIMHVHLDLPVGKWRFLSKNEVDQLYGLVENSRK